MNRRSFMGAILAAGVAPAFIGSSILMPVRQILAAPLLLVPDDKILLPGQDGFDLLVSRTDQYYEFFGHTTCGQGYEQEAMARGWKPYQGKQ